MKISTCALALTCSLAIAGAAHAQQGNESSRADLNNDAMVDTVDLLMLLTEWGQPQSSADLDDNGSVELFDLNILLRVWGEVEGGNEAGPLNPAQHNAQLLWREDFELNNYSRWTGGYDPNWSSCVNSGFSTETAVGSSRSHKSEVFCTQSPNYAHRGYGGVQFSGNNVLPAYTNTGTGVQAQHGIVNTFWSHLEAGDPFVAPRWFSFWTANNECDYSDRVITIGLENASNRITPAHILNTGGTVTWEPNAPAFPMGEWVRITVYVNYHTGDMVLWQNGAKLWTATFDREDSDVCQIHWGLYASRENDDITLYEDDITIFKLNSPWFDFDVEPWFGMP